MFFKATTLLCMIGICSAAPDFDIGHSHAYSCTDKVRVCQSDEKPFNQAGDRICTENKMNRPTVRIDAQNWPSALQNTWMMQVIMQELMQIPIELNDDRNLVREDRTHDFYNGDSCANCAGWSAPAYTFDGLAQAHKDFTCSELDAQGKPKACAHIMTEIWSGKLGQLNQGILVDKTMTKAGALGVFGRLGWFVQKWVADAYGGFTYRELNNAAITTQFGKPLRWGEHCAEQAGVLTPAQYSTSACKFWVDSTDTDWKATIVNKFMVSKTEFTSAMLTAATNAGVTDIPADPTTHVWAGRLKPYASGKAHIMECPCSWTTYYPLQMPTVNAEAVQYTYGEMLDIWETMAYNLKLVDRSQPMANWHNDPHWYPIIGWWWTPDAFPIKYETAGDQYRLESVYLEPWTGKCEAARQNVFVPKFKDGPAGTAICESGTYNYTLNPDWRTECGQACVDARCDYPADGLLIATSESLGTHMPDVMKMLGKLNIDTSVQLGWLGTDIHNRSWIPAKKRLDGTSLDGDQSGLRSRDIVCQYIRENIDTVSTWLPDTHQNTGCRISSTDSICSGQGSCMPNQDASLPGYCKCNAGYSGDQCERPDTAFLPPSIFTSAVLTEDNNRFFKWDAIGNETCCALDGDGECTTDGAVKACPTTIDAYAGKTGKGDDSGQSGIAGYRISAGKQVSKIVKVFQPSAGLGALGIALGAIGVVISVVFMAWTMALKSKPVILFSQPTFLLTVLVGAILEFVSIMLLSNGYMSSEQCYASAWTGHLGFALSFSALFAKTRRLNKLFNNKKLRKMRITNKDVFMVVGAITGMSAVVLVAWTILGGVDKKALQQSYGAIYERANHFDVYVGCNSESGSVPIFILLGGEGLLLLFSVFAAYTARNINVSFGESKWIAIVIYNIFIIGIVAVVISFVGPGTIDPDGLFIVQVICQFAGTLMSISVLFLPKLLFPEQSSGDTATSGTAQTSNAGASGSNSVVVAPKSGESAA